jgi:hypothetical protein
MRARLSLTRRCATDATASENRPARSSDTPNICAIPSLCVPGSPRPGVIPGVVPRQGWRPLFDLCVRARSGVPGEAHTRVARDVERPRSGVPLTGTSGMEP